MCERAIPIPKEGRNDSSLEQTNYKFPLQGPKADLRWHNTVSKVLNKKINVELAERTTGQERSKKARWSKCSKHGSVI